MLVRTIVVAGDGARADIDVIANLRIAPDRSDDPPWSLSRDALFSFPRSYQRGRLPAVRRPGADGQMDRWCRLPAAGHLHHAVGANFAVIADGAVLITQPAPIFTRSPSTTLPSIITLVSISTSRPCCSVPRRSNAPDRAASRPPAAAFPPAPPGRRAPGAQAAGGC